jgi:N-acetylglutamate synthase-like GNAT family acetyltransferase
MARLLTAASLPPFPIGDHWDTFWVLEDRGEVVGMVGLEVYVPSALLRSVVVDERLRGSGFGDLLTETALSEARSRAVQCVYLFTMDRAQFFARFGFEACTMDDFDPEGRRSSQYQALVERPDIAAMLTPMRCDLPG